VEEFQKDIMAIVKSSVPQAVTWQELLEETHTDTERLDLKEAVARGYLMVKEKRVLELQYDSIFMELAVIAVLVVRGARRVIHHALQHKVGLSIPLKLEHKAHQGITKTKKYLCTRVWFPGLDKMVEAHIQHSHPCQVVTESQE